ncbi:UPF0061 protein [Diplonema papillatum]|nr:UPF0061 protein [Diplonema papillatum]
MAGAGIAGLLSRVDDTLTKTLTRDSEGGDQFQPRQVARGHFVDAAPEAPPDPLLVAVSPGTCRALDLDPQLALSDARFAELFAGTAVPPGLRPWATAYGCHHRGSFMGQMGDGRAVSLCEVAAPGPAGEERWEIQLKGGGRTPFNRGFDGKCVLRSCVREFLMSEHMAALGVPTTRSLAVFATGELVARPWFDVGDLLKLSAGDISPPTSPRHRMMVEQGGLTVRVAPHFLRFGHFELWWRREDPKMLEGVADYALSRCFPHLLPAPPGPGAPLSASEKAKAYVSMFSECLEKSAQLVAQWMGLGYVHGNMNSDNMSITGLTLDYGPFGMMPAFNPDWNPWVVSPGYAYTHQPSVMRTNLTTLAASMMYLTTTLTGHTSHETSLEARLSSYEERYKHHWDEIRRKKLGFASWSPQADALWDRLTLMMSVDAVDYTLFFRELCSVSDADGSTKDTRLPSSFTKPKSSDGDANYDVAEWDRWLADYIELGKALGGRDASAMKKANPAIVLRNYMAAEAYAAAEKGDFGPVRELCSVVTSNPYSDDGMTSKYYKPVPRWAESLPGVFGMTCSS